MLIIPFTQRQAKKRTKRRVVAETKAANAQPLPGERKYCVIYADPPWTFETYSELGKDRSAENHSMSAAKTSIRVAGRKYVPGADNGVAALMTASSWVLGRLPALVLEEQRRDLIRTLREARDLTVEVAIAPKPLVRVRDGARLLVEIPANGAG